MGEAPSPVREETTQQKDSPKQGLQKD